MAVNADLNCSITIKTKVDKAREVQQRIINGITLRNCPPPALRHIQLALEETLMNAIKHGNQRDTNKEITIDYKVQQKSTMLELTVTVTDQGPGFNPDNVPDPTLPENLERTSGRGIFLIRSFMDSVHFNQSGNAVTFTKTFVPEADAILQDSP